MTAPVRMQLRRTRGFRLQDHSRALNGLPCVKVDRTTRWGNPFVPGRENPYVAGATVRDRRHAAELFAAHAPLDAALVAAARAELRGKNLACWCPCLDPHDRFECHAQTLLEIANG